MAFSIVRVAVAARDSRAVGGDPRRYARGRARPSRGREPIVRRLAAPRVSRHRGSRCPAPANVCLPCRYGTWTASPSASPGHGRRAFDPCRGHRPFDSALQQEKQSPRPTEVGREGRWACGGQCCAPAAPQSSCCVACTPLSWDMFAAHLGGVGVSAEPQIHTQAVAGFRDASCGTHRARRLPYLRAARQSVLLLRMLRQLRRRSRPSALTRPYLFRRIARLPAGLHARPAPRGGTRTERSSPDPGPGADPAPPRGHLRGCC